MIVTKINESYSVIDGDQKVIKAIYDFLRVERPGAYFEPAVKSGFKSPYEYFAKIHEKKLIIMNGHLELLTQFGIYTEKNKPEFSESDLESFLQDVKSKLPFNLYDFQEIAFKESILNIKQFNKMCTGSGKSIVICLICEFFLKHSKRGLLVVPNINLLTQFKSDIKNYNLINLFDNTFVIGGGENQDRIFGNALTISTWQSMIKCKDRLDKFDYIITDEAHRFASDETSAIIKETTKCKYKFGFTGTIPDDPVMKMELFGLFGKPKVYITSRELIERKLATPVKINSIVFNYSDNDKAIFNNISEKTNTVSNNKYAKQLKFIKDHQKRNEFIVNLSCKLKHRGNTLILFQHTDHGKMIFIDIMCKLFPEIKIENKDITGKKSFEFQEKYGIYFLNGEDDSKTREKTRLILEEHSDAILVSGYQLLSTGVNIKKLHNMVLSSPLKSYTTITQSIGRGMRLHESKKEFNVYDLVDSTGFKKNGGPFYKQYLHRIKTSYNTEEFPIIEREFCL